MATYIRRGKATDAIFAHVVDIRAHAGTRCGMTKEDYIRAIDESVVQLFDELCTEAKFPKDATDAHGDALRRDLRALWVQARGEVDWEGLMRTLTPEEAAEGLKSLLRETTRQMMAAEGLLPN